MQIVLRDERTRKRGRVGTGRVLPSHLSQAVAISPSRRIRPSCKSRHSGNQRHIRPVSFIERNARPVSRERLSIRFDGTSVVSMGRSIISDVSLTVERRVMNILAGPTLAGKTTIVRLIAGLKVAALNVASPVRQGKSYRPRSHL